MSHALQRAVGLSPFQLRRLSRLSSICKNSVVAVARMLPSSLNENFPHDPSLAVRCHRNRRRSGDRRQRPHFEPVDKAIRAGDYKRSDQCVVARDGKLVYEAYFDEGGAQARRDARSATKTPWPACWPASPSPIARGLAGAQAPILPYLRRQAPAAEPRPAPSSSPSRT